MPATITANVKATLSARLIPPSYIKPYLRRQKNDAADAAAICEAVRRPSMRFVPVKSRDQQATLMLHGARELLISHRTALINALRGHFAELGIVVPQGARNVRQLIALLKDEQHSPQAVRVALMPLAMALTQTETQVARLDKAILAAHRNDDVSIRLATVPGIDPVIATCLSASVPDAKLFECGREFAAWLGLVPRQHSTGGKPRLGTISKMGNRHLRKLLVVDGAFWLGGSSDRATVLPGDLPVMAMYHINLGFPAETHDSALLFNGEDISPDCLSQNGTEVRPSDATRCEVELSATKSGGARFRLKYDGDELPFLQTLRNTDEGINLFCIEPSTHDRLPRNQLRESGALVPTPRASSHLFHLEMQLDSGR